jgi:hypothetical protein
MTPAVISLFGVSAAMIVGLLVAWVRWSIGTAVRLSIQQTVNGKVDAVQRTVDQLQRTLDVILETQSKHETSHTVEQSALLAALARQGLDLPDGWHA